MHRCVPIHTLPHPHIPHWTGTAALVQRLGSCKPHLTAPTPSPLPPPTYPLYLLNKSVDISFPPTRKQISLGMNAFKGFQKTAWLSPQCLRHLTLFLPLNKHEACTMYLPYANRWTRHWKFSGNMKQSLLSRFTSCVPGPHHFLSHHVQGSQ